MHDAADLAEHALRLTPPSAAEYTSRLLMFAQWLVEVGELSRVTRLLGPRVGELPAGAVRARAYLLLGEAAGLAEHEDYLERALAESGNDPALRPAALATKSLLLAVVRVARIGEAEALAAQAHRLARQAEAEVRRHAQQMLAWARILGGNPAGELSDGLPGLAGNASLYESSIDPPRRCGWRSVATSARRGGSSGGCWRRPMSGARPGEQTAAMFAEMGAPGWAGLACSELARIPARRPRPAGELTPAERQAAELAATGLSNKQIARRLSVSVHTVEVHLSRAYRKLGIRSRAELAGRLPAHR